MPIVQIVAVTTTDIGPTGPIKKIYAVGVETPEAALEHIEKRLKQGEKADCIDARHLNLAAGEIRQI
jgi:hypothetical protein